MIKHCRAGGVVAGGEGNLRYLSRYDTTWDWGVSDIPQSRHSSLTASVEFRHQPVSWWLRGNFRVAPLVCRSSIKFDPFEECWQENEKNICIKFYSRFSGTNYSIKLTRLLAKFPGKKLKIKQINYCLDLFQYWKRGKWKMKISLTL